MSARLFAANRGGGGGPARPSPLKPPSGAAARREAAIAACNARLRLAGLAFAVCSLAGLYAGGALFGRDGSGRQLRSPRSASAADAEDGGAADDASPPPLRRPPGFGRKLVSLGFPLPGERPPVLVPEKVELTGAPPLTSRSDASPDGNPDFVNRGLLYPAAFSVVDAVASAAGDSKAGAGDAADRLIAYVRKSEDAIKDVVVATLASTGRVRDGDARVSCKASPVTAKWQCAAAVVAGAAAAGVPPPPMWLLDVGSTSAGYYGLLAGAYGFPSLLVDPQPHCGYLAQAAAEGSSSGKEGAAPLASLLHTATYFPDGPRANGSPVPRTPVPVRWRSGCVGTSSTDFPPSPAGIAAAYGGPPQGMALVNVSRRSLDDIVYDAASGVPPEAVFPVVKIDASGREDNVLRGAARLLGSGRALSVIVEINKQQLARRLGVGSIEGGGGGGRDALPPPGHAVDGIDPLSGYDPAPVPRRRLAISDAENALLSAHIASLARSMFAFGYESLSSDNGWWAAQDPKSAATDTADPGALDAWAAKVMRHGEIDLWFYLPDTRPGLGGGAGGKKG